MTKQPPKLARCDPRTLLDKQYLTCIMSKYIDLSIIKETYVEFIVMPNSIKKIEENGSITLNDGHVISPSQIRGRNKDGHIIAEERQGLLGFSRLNV